MKRSPILRPLNRKVFLQKRCCHETYYKLTNKREKHYDFQYKNGLNILTQPFNDNPNDSCIEGGFYFSDAKNIFNFLDFSSYYLRKIKLPTSDPDFKMVRDPLEDKWRCNKIILGERLKLSDPEVYKLLLSEISNNYDRILNYSSFHGNLRVIKFLVANGFPINNDDALILSSSNGHLSTVKFFVKHGVDIDVKKRTALLRASMHGHLNVVKFMVEKAGCTNQEWINAAMRYAAYEGYLNIVAYLLDQGANIHIFDNEVLTTASRNGHLALVKFLVKNGANVCAGQNRALQCASENGHLNVVKFLVNNGAKIHADGDDALIQSSYKGYFGVVKYLLEHGANIHAQNNKPLVVATYNRNIKICEFLVRHGADIDVALKHFQTKGISHCLSSTMTPEEFLTKIKNQIQNMQK